MASSKSPRSRRQPIPNASAVSAQLAELQQGVLLHRQGRLAEAKLIYESVQQTNSELFQAPLLLGTLAAQEGHFQVAVNWLDQAIELNKNHADAHYNRGIALRGLAQLEASVASYDQAIRLNPEHANAYLNRGIALKELRQFENALVSFNKAIAIKPDFADAYYNRGSTLNELHQLPAAIASYDQAIQLKPDFADAFCNRGISLVDQGQTEAAIASFDRAIQIKPDLAEAYQNRGNLLAGKGQTEAAIASFDKAIELKPDLAEAYFSRGNELYQLKLLDRALDSYRQALKLNPEIDFVLGQYLQAQLAICDWSELADHLSRYEAGIRSQKKTANPFSVLGFLEDPELHQMAAKIYYEALYSSTQPVVNFSPRVPSEKIRIGYYSADFHNHATAHLMAELFEAHDKGRFELSAFSFGPNSNHPMRQRLAVAFDQFNDVASHSAQDIAALSRELGIDIAIDLKGYTKDSRSEIFAYRCAPIQVNYLGYPGTMACDAMDYIIADKVVIPEANQIYFSEKVVYLPHSYQVNDSKRAISDRKFTKQELGLPEVGFVFCCFNNNYKILPATFDSWMQILSAVPGSVLWLLEDHPSASKNLKNEAIKRGIESHRLIFAKRMSLEEHLARHRCADLFLDTLPYNAHTTSSDALWAGLPVLTCTGSSFAARVSASLLHAIQLPELITDSRAEFEAKAIHLARNPHQLQEIKEKLESKRLTTPLFDGALFAKHLESAYEKMFDRYQSGLAPASIEVSS
jgi:predicted O-linked N-acetylglucosamine transferase (SPINDLY family)